VSDDVRSFDSRELRQVLGSFVTGVTVITTVDAQSRPHGLTVNSFSSVSLDPPLILWSQSNTAPSHPVFSTAERFTVNILADDQVELSSRFARASADKFAGLPVATGLGGVPLLAGCAAHLECRRVHSYPGGDHTVFIGEVERVARHPRQPLVFGGGRYLVTQPHDIGPLPSERGENIARLQAVRVATRALAELSDELDETLGLGVWGNKGPTIVRWEESRTPVSDNLRTGLVLPVLSSATGLAFAAWLPRGVTAPFLDAELLRDASGTFYPDADRLPQRLAQMRTQGFVRLVGTDDFSDFYGSSISAASVPVFAGQGAMVLALTAIGATDRLNTAAEGRLLTRMRQCAQELGARLKGTAAASSVTPSPITNETNS
jgi:flavin reductase (DIM6/NTAB) family NADH-FMN oxidoreductase RutF/DNA-binding IclR family transcriptional regulator